MTFARSTSLVLLVCAMAAYAGSAPPSGSNALTAGEIEEGWILMWDGESTFGWTPQIAAEWRGQDGALFLAEGAHTWLRHKTPFADFVLEAEFRMKTAEADSGVFIRAAADGDPTQTGFQVNINNRNSEYGTGSIVGRVRTDAPPVPVGEWHRFRITAEGTRVTVLLNGRKTAELNEPSPRVGYIGLQFVRPGEVEFRGVRLRPLGLDPLFSGTDLAGWEIVERPNARAIPEWSVRDEAIHVEKGPGQLETTREFADFVLQMDIRTNPRDENHHPNSGVFFRGDKGRSWSGYESQIRNEFRDGDRTKPVDFGTGGLYHFQPARRVIPRDGAYFTKTVVVHGRQIAIWVNGIQVSDFEDRRQEGPDARNNARIAAGPISLQAHDPTTNLDFRRIRIAALPPR